MKCARFPAKGIVRGATISCWLPIIAFSFGAAWGAVVAAPVALVTDGKSDYTIVLDAHATAAERFAAQELQSYLALISGATLPIEPNAASPTRIVIGAHPLANGLEVPARYPGDDAFAIKTDRRGALLLKGANPRGTLFAAYALLETLGCRWFAPGVAALDGHHEFVPRRATITLPPLDILDQPLMRIRKRDADLGRRSHTAATWPAVFDWMGKQRSNAFAISIDAYEKNRELFRDECTRRGMLLFVGQHAFVERFLSRAEYSRTHPEWFGLIDGNRTARAKGNPVMFETANAEAVRMFHANIISYLRLRPEIDVLQLWPPDGALWSESPESIALGTPADRMAKLVNETSGALREAGLKTRVAFLAYSSFADPPNALRADPAAILEFCPINQNPRFELREARAETNATYYAQLRGWLDLLPGAVTHYSYYAKYSWRSLPVVLPQQIGAEIRHWHQLGEVGTSLYCEPGNWLTLEANHLSFAKASWDSHFDGSAWFDEYLHDRFGKAADSVKRFYTAVTAISLDALIPQSRTITPKAARPLLEEARAALREAGAQADNEDAKWFIGRIAWQPEYLERALDLRDTELANQPGTAARAAIATLVTAHANDGTILDRGFGYRNSD